MTKATVASQIHQSLDVHRDFSSKLTLNLEFTVNDLSYVIGLLFSKGIGFKCRIDPNLGKYLSGSCPSNAIDIG